MAVEESFLPVGGTRKNLDTVVVEQTDGTPVHREAVFIADPEVTENRCNVVRLTDGTYAQKVEVSLSDSANIDGNGRLRVANPVNLFLNKNVHSKNDNQWEEPIVGAIIVHGAVTSGPFQVAETITGGTSGTIATVTAVDGGSLTVTYMVNHNDFQDGETITGGTSGATAAVTTHNTGSNVTHERDTSSAILQVGALDGDQAIRQSHRYIPYRPGKNQHITLTFLFGAAVANVTRCVGYYDDENGLFLQQTGTTVSVVRRTKTSGSVVDNETLQADWSNDALDGSGPSGLTLDLSKVQYVIIDFQWQGVGRVRWGFELNGVVIYFHEEPFTNVDTVPFMSTPSLPVRYEIVNTAATAGVNTMREICSSVVSEGGERLTGLGFAESHDIAPRTVTTALTPILAVRLKSAVAGGGDNRKTLEFRAAAIFVEGNNNAHYHVSRLHDPSGFAGDWVDVGGDSEAEYSVNVTAITGNPKNTMEEGYAAGAGGSGKALGQQDIRADIVDQHHLITQNFDSTNSEVLLLSAQSHASTATVFGTLSWIEYE